ncbi:PAS domain S-box protein [Brevibacillus ruminantium]|uniref:histidine kinase n=1 Tax=Brevibacillus ruminantium TaxID=2950604 RepID=A0ABY4WGD1_9BACL|nr:PAS domain S-box protein [Brevibacillus ruminantium]USG65087.1 PAS domain S-box protein [Brevibacillus ruminantium]
MNRLIALDSCASLSLERVKLEQEWEQFITGVKSKPLIRSVMYESWQRCQEQNINPLHNKAAINLSKEQIEEYMLTELHYPILKPLLLQLQNQSIDAGHLITFCNSSGDIVYLDGDVSLMLKAEDMNFVNGSSWAENKAGTNAIGTSLVTGSPIQVFAGEHFCQEVQKWTCSAAPIRDPATQKILGVMNMTGLWRAYHPHSLSAVISAAQKVEQELYKQLEQERFRLTENYSQLQASSAKTPFLILDRGCKVIHASPMLYIEGWIDANDFLVGAPSTPFPLTSRMQWEVEHRKGFWRFELSPYIYGGNPIGAIVYVFPPNVIKPVPNERIPKSLPVETAVESVSGDIVMERSAAKSFIKSDAFYKSLFEDNPSAIICYDLQGNILEANPAVERLIGHTIEELRNINIESLILPEYVDKRVDHFAKVRMGKPQEIEIAVRHKNGHTIDVRIHYFPMFDQHEIIGIYGIAKDITKHKQIEEDLKSTKEQLELYLKNTVDSIVVLDLHFKVIKVNRAFERMFGWTEQEVIGGDLPTIPDYLHDEFSRLQQEIVISRHVTSYETVRQRRDGSLLDVNTFVSPLSDTEGNVIAFVAILRDITERKRMEEALKEKEKQLRTLINAMPDSVCFKDGEGRWVEANDCCLRTFQLENTPFQGKRDSELAAIAPFFSTALLLCEESDNKVWEKGSTVRLEEIIPQPDGECKVFDVSKVPLFNSDGRRKGIVVISRDITELKRTEELLRKSDKLSVVGRLAAGVAHEIRNPLTSIRGFIQFIKEGNYKEEYFHMVLSELDRIQSVVNEFLVLAKPQATNFQPRELTALLNQVVELLKTEAIMNDVQIEVEFERTLLIVNCEENQLKQVFINILKNAIEAMPNGGEIKIQLQQQQNAVSIRFIDQGDGIDEDRIQKLGEPFYTTKEKGTGLGLMISYKIVQAHRGGMKINSQKNRGTTVEIMLPIE